MSDTPSSWEEVTVWHKITYYTIMPVILIGLSLLVSIPVLYILGWINFQEAFLFSWAIYNFILLYFMLMGDYVMPAETYRKYRSGEW